MTTSLADQFEALKPCPFCGADAILRTREMRDRDDAIAECGRDECQAMVYGDTEAEAIAAWNNRAAISSALTATPPVQEGWRAIEKGELDAKKD